jgi:hypothetical protein
MDRQLRRLARLSETTLRSLNQETKDRIKRALLTDPRTAPLAREIETQATLRALLRSPIRQP